MKNVAVATDFSIAFLYDKFIKLCKQNKAIMK